ncbi:MAG: GTPase HflX [Oscillospiraceae bacterium]|jgi:GTP-binding protein HflX|nr:GTPase HflX [Oscillospiraceae bacterium]
MTLHENSIDPELSLLVGLDTGSYDAQASIDELEELAQTAGAQVFAKIVQKRERPNPAIFVGSGRLDEIRDMCSANDIDLIIFDDELSPSQQRNIEDFTGVRVIDRTTLILDIFAMRAKSKEGKIQVELAQLNYMLPRLSGKGVQLSRLGAGIGTRGPGESKLESDRRHISRRIDSLRSELQQIEKRRVNTRAKRIKDGVESVAIVGYTNAGKSTLMNKLTNAGVLALDKLFATLDPTARALSLPDGRKVMLIDTVGLVRRLPHKLIQSFKSTLEEAVLADVILNVCDVSSPECANHLDVTAKLLEELGACDKPIISVMNKCDLVENVFDMPLIGKVVMISAKYGTGIDELLDIISTSLPQKRRSVSFLFPFNKVGLVSDVRKDGVVLKEEYHDRGLFITAVADITVIDRLKDYVAD